MEHVLTGCGKRAERSSVEAVHEGDYVASALAVLVEAVLTCDLDCAFVGFRAGVAEEHISVARGLAESLREISLHLCVVIVGGVLNLVSLVADSPDPVFVAVAQRVSADSAAEIYVFLAVFVYRLSAGAAVKNQVVPAVTRHNVFVELFYCTHNDLLRNYHRARTDVGEKLDKDRMRDTPVDDVGLFNSAADCFNAAVNLGNHSAGYNALILEVGYFAYADYPD